MNDSLIALPILMQVTLVIILYFALAIAKKKAVAAGTVNLERRGLFDDAWPTNVIQINNCIRNQFELPILFYVMIGLLWALDSINLFVHITAWIFVLSRVAHAYVHTHGNHVPLRRRFFTIGALAIIILMVAAIQKIAL